MAKSSIITNIFFFSWGLFWTADFFTKCTVQNTDQNNVSPSLNEIRWSKMLFLIEKKLLGLVYMWNRDLLLWPAEYVICQINIYFKNYEKEDSTLKNWGWTVSKNYHYNILLLSSILSIHMYTIIILYSLRYSKVTSLFEVGIIVYLFHPICWPDLVIFHGSTPLKCTWGYTPT